MRIKKSPSPETAVSLEVGLRRATVVRQAELIGAALEIIATRGISALSTRTLAAQVGLSSGAIFRHYASLEALLVAVVGRVEEVLEATYPPRDLPALPRLERFIEARSEAVGQQRGVLRLMLSEQFLFALPKDGNARLLGCVRKTREFIVECLREAQQDRSIRADLEPAALAVVVMGTIQMLALSNIPNSPHRAIEAALARSALLALLSARAAQ